MLPFLLVAALWPYVCCLLPAVWVLARRMLKTAVIVDFVISETAVVVTFAAMVRHDVRVHFRTPCKNPTPVGLQSWDGRPVWLLRRRFCMLHVVSPPKRHDLEVIHRSFPQ